VVDRDSSVQSSWLEGASSIQYDIYNVKFSKLFSLKYLKNLL